MLWAMVSFVRNIKFNGARQKDLCLSLVENNPNFDWFVADKYKLEPADFFCACKALHRVENELKRIII